MFVSHYCQMGRSSLCTLRMLVTLTPSTGLCFMLLYAFGIIFAFLCVEKYLCKCGQGLKFLTAQFISVCVSNIEH